MSDLRFSMVLPFVFLIIAGGITVPVMISGLESVYLSAVSSALFLFVLFSTVVGIVDSRRACLLPYFERSLGDIDTFLGGEALLWHSGELDAIARDLECTPLSHFLSGDSLLVGEECTLFAPADALATVAVLRQSPHVVALDPAVNRYLAKLHHALHRAARSEVPLPAPAQRNLRQRPRDGPAHGQLFLRGYRGGMVTKPLL